MGKGKTTASNLPFVSPSAAKQPKQPSKQALALHSKWQQTAKDMGGGRIVVKKEQAKELVKEILHDSFRPMNITEIYQVSSRSKSQATD